MRGKFAICLLGGLVAECSLLFLVLPKMGWLAELVGALAATALILLLYLLLTRGNPMAGERGRLLTILWMVLAEVTMIAQRGAGALLTTFMLAVQVVAALWLDSKNVRCSNCGKHMPLFGDMDRCPACGTVFSVCEPVQKDVDSPGT